MVSNPGRQRTQWIRQRPGKDSNTKISCRSCGVDELQPSLRTVASAAADGSGSIIGRLQQKASMGDDDALATLRMLEAMHGSYSRGRPMRMSVSPPVDQRVRPDAGNRSPETMFNRCSRCSTCRAQRIRYWLIWPVRGIRRRCRHSECSRQFG